MRLCSRAGESKMSTAVEDLGGNPGVQRNPPFAAKMIATTCASVTAPPLVATRAR